MIDYRRLRVALLGAGAVGSQVAALLLKHGDELADRAGAALELVAVLAQQRRDLRADGAGAEKCDPEAAVVGHAIPSIGGW